jgi:PTH1 family peptidyl-tRNA hydrolase
MKLIVGLGNPGKKYESTRHNAGWQVLDALRESWEEAGFGAWQKKFDGEICQGKSGREKVILLKPLTFMNESGRSAAQAVKFFKTKPSDVVVAYDDKDLPLGAIRVRAEGSAGGHNGMKSVLAALNTQNVARVRVGIGQPRRDEDTADFVLSKFSRQEKELFDAAVAKAAEAARMIVTDGVIETMNKTN